MEERLIKILKELKNIIPDNGFISRSRNLILSSPQIKRGLRASFFESFKLATALSLASVLLFILVGGLSLLNVKNLSPVVLTSLNDESLKAEEEKLDFQIQLGQISYPTAEDKEIGAKVDELLKNLSL
jgi:hypothetical protein